MSNVANYHACVSLNCFYDIAVQLMKHACLEIVGIDYSLTAVISPYLSSELDCGVVNSSLNTSETVVSTCATPIYYSFQS